MPALRPQHLLVLRTGSPLQTQTRFFHGPTVCYSLHDSIVSQGAAHGAREQEALDQNV